VAYRYDETGHKYVQAVTGEKGTILPIYPEVVFIIFQDTELITNETISILFRGRSNPAED
jgi:hypothetical protein